MHHTNEAAIIEKKYNKTTAEGTSKDTLEDVIFKIIEKPTLYFGNQCCMGIINAIKFPKIQSK